MKRTPFMRALAIGAVVALLGACGSGDGDSTKSGDTVTITWLHNSNTDPGKAYYDSVAKDFEADMKKAVGPDTTKTIVVHAERRSR